MEQQLGCRFFLDKAYEDKKIVIYGASVTGKTLYRQIRDRNFAQVAAFVDRNVEHLQDSDIDCEVYKPEWLFGNTGYDFIFLGTSSLDLKEDMTEFLVDNGIEADRIIFPGESFFDGEQEYRMIDDVDVAFQQLIQADVGLKREGEEELAIQFWGWMRLYFQSLSDREGFVTRIKYESIHHPSLNARILLGRYLFELQELDASGMKRYLAAIDELPEDQYEWVFMLYWQSAFMELRQKKVLYQELGRDRRRIGKKLASYFCDIERQDFSDYRENSNRIVILAPGLAGENSAYSMVFREMANMLSEKGKEILLLVVLAPKKQCFGFLSTRSNKFSDDTKKYYEKNREWLDDSVLFEVIEEGRAKDILNRVIHRVNEFQPGCIVDATDELCPISAILYQYYPILNYPFRTCTVASFFHRTRVAPFEYNREVDPYRIQLPPLMVKKEAAAVYSREEKLQIPEDSFVMITPGTRLGMEITPPLVDAIMALLEKREDMYWILVGDIGVSKHFSTDMAAYDKIRILPFEEDLIALYRLCDVYLNPDRMGGGFSIRFAMQEGVAVASLNVGAAANWIDRQWLVEGGYKELCEYIERLYEDDEMLVRIKEQMKKNIAKKRHQGKWADAVYHVVEELSKMEIRDFHFEI